MHIEKSLRRLLLSLATLLLCCLGPVGSGMPSASAQTSTEPALALEWLGSFGGQTQGIQLDGDRVYVSLGERVLGLDISDPQAIEIAWALTARPSMLLLHDRTLLLFSEEGIELVDISETPPKRGQWIEVEDIGGAAASINVRNDKYPQRSEDLVAVDVGVGIAILRFDTDDSLTRVAVIEIEQWGRPYALVGERLFLQAGVDDPISIYDVSGVGPPTRLGEIPFAAAIGIVATQEDRVLALGHRTLATPEQLRWIYAFDVADPANPRRLWEWDSGEGILIKGLRLSAHDGRAWLQQSIPAQVWELDPSDPAGPRFGQTIELNLIPMTAQGDLVAAAESLVGLGLFQEQPDGSYEDLGRYEEPSRPSSPRSAGDLIAALGVGEGMGLIDVRDLDRPKELGSLPYPAFESRNDLPFGGVPLGRFVDASASHVSHSWGWDLAQAGHLWTVDIRDPMAPQALELADIGAPFGVYQSGSRSYVPLRFGGISIFDSASSNQPNRLGKSGPGPATTAALTVDDTILYGGSTYLLGAYDISDPANVRALEFSHRGHPHALAEGGGMLYAPGYYPPLAMPWNGHLPSTLTQTLDRGLEGAISAARPGREASQATVPWPDEVEAPRGQRRPGGEDEPRPQLTATQFPTGVNPALVIVDISTPEAPQLRAQLPLRGSLQYQVSVHEDLLLLGGYGPLEAFDLSTPDAPAPLHWATPVGAAHHQYWSDDAQRLITHGDLLVREGNGLQFFRPYRHEIEVVATTTPSPSATFAATRTPTPTPSQGLPGTDPPSPSYLYLPFLQRGSENP